MRVSWVSLSLLGLVACSSAEVGTPGSDSPSDSGHVAASGGSGGSAVANGAGGSSSGASGAVIASADDSGGVSPNDASAGGGGGNAGGGAADASQTDPPGIFVAVGYGGRTVRSIDDGATWIDDTSLVAQGGDDKNLLRTVLWGNREFVALGWRVMKSTDGKVWDDRGEIIGQWIGSAAYVKGTYVAIGGYGLRVTSSDALTFQHHDIDTIASHPHDGLSFGDYQGGRFVAANDDGKRTYSSDGKTWMPGGGAAATTKTSELAFGNGVFLGVGARDVVISKDGGATWTAGGALPAAGNGLVFAQGHFTVLSNGHVFTSMDGTTWDDHAVKGISGGGLAYGHGTYVLVQGTSRRRSKDGLAWDAAVMGGTNSLEWLTFGPLP